MADVRLIDANALDKILVQEYLMYNDVENTLTLAGTQVYNAAIDTARSKIREANTIYAAPVVHGRWVHSDGKSIVCYCSECGGKILYNPNPRTYNIKKPKVEQYNKFCRNCGAKMDGGAQE